MILGKETKKTWLSAELGTGKVAVLTINKLKDNH